MAASAWEMYSSFKQVVGDADVDLNTDSFYVALLASGYTPNPAHTQYSQLTNELATLSGYTAGGQLLTSVTWTTSGETATFDSADPAWKANGGDISCRYAVVYSTTGNELVCMCDLGTGSDVTVTDGNTMTIQINANGYFQMSHALLA